MIRVLLRTPLLCRAVGKRLITVHVVGRTSGRHYTVPVAYTRHQGIILIGTEFAWVRNLRTGEPVEIRLRGRRRRAEVQVLSDEAGVVEHYAVLARGNHQWAKFNKIALDRAGNPNAEDLHLAWAAGRPSRPAHTAVSTTPPTPAVPCRGGWAVSQLGVSAANGAAGAPRLARGRRVRVGGFVSRAMAGLARREPDRFPGAPRFPALCPPICRTLPPMRCGGPRTPRPRIRWSRVRR